MPHDVKGAPLQPGDTVVLRCKIVEVQATEDFCNVRVESILGRRPDGLKETIYSINTGVLEKTE